MSWPAVAWALGQRAPSSAAKFLLVVLADSASAGDWLSWPSVAFLSDTTQQDRKTVLANLQRLQEHKLIAPAGKTGRTGQIAVWRLPVVVPGKRSKSPESGTVSTGKKSPKTGTLTATETVPVFPPKSPSFPVKESQFWDTEPVRNPKGTRERARAARSPAPDRGSRLPADWTLPQDWRAWAIEARPDLAVDEVASGFADHWHGKAGRDAVKADWFATWRNWVRRERARSAGVVHGASFGPNPLDDGHVFGVDA